MMGVTQTSPKTFFIARGLISPDGEELYDITQFLETEGNGGITKNNTSPEASTAGSAKSSEKTVASNLFVFYCRYDWKIWGDFQAR